MSQQPTHHLHLLGDARLSGPAGEVIQLPVKHLAVVAYLSLEHDRLHDRQRIAELFWPHVGDGRERDNLRLAVHTIRTAVGEPPAWLVANRRQVGITTIATAAASRDAAVGGLLVDAVELLRSGVALGTQPSAGIAAADVAALAPLVPPGLADLAVWWESWNERVRAAAVAGLAAVGRAALEGGQVGAAQDTADRLLHIDALAEEGHELHIRAHLAAQRLTEARRHLDRYDVALRRSLDVGAPEHLRDLLTHAAVQVGHASQIGQVDAARSPDPVAAGDRPLVQLPLPSPTTPFTGRATELTELRDLLRRRSSRLITIVGPGGAGKTRLALEVAAQEQRRFEERAAFVRLDAIGDASALPARLAQTLGLFGVTAAADTLDALCATLADREVLIVADNVEHLVGPSAGRPSSAADPVPTSVAGVFGELVRRCPHVLVLATSRVPLGARDERLVPLGGLPLPGADHLAARVEVDSLARLEAVDAVQLLLDRLRRHDRRITFDRTSAATVAEICRLVGGLPLGLELAASSIRVLTLEEIAETLRTTPTDLPSTLPDAPARQRDLDAVYATTVRILSTADRHLLEQLAVFVGGFSAEHADEIAEADPEALTRLVDVGLLDHQPDGRYRMHELIRQLATSSRAARPGPDTVQDRHARRFLSDLTEAETALNRAGAAKVAGQLDADRGNIIQAWSHGVERGWHTALLQASAGLTSWSLTSGTVTEHRELVDGASRLARRAHDRATWLLREISALQPSATTAGPTVALVDQIVSLVGDDPDSRQILASAALERGIVLVEHESRIAEGRAAMLRAAELARTGHPVLQAFVELRLGYLALDVGHFDDAADRMSHAARMLEDEGHLRGAATARKGLAHVHDERWDLWPALQAVEAAETTFGALGNRTWTVYCQELRGTVLARLGQFEQASTALETVIRYLTERAGPATAAYSLGSLGVAQAGLGETARGLQSMADGISALRAAGESNMLRYHLFDFVRHLRDHRRLIEAKLDADELIRLNGMMESDILLAAAHALRAHVRLPQGRTAEVVDDIERAWEVIEGSVDRLLHPLETLLECRDVFLRLGRVGEADAALSLATTRLRTVARAITDVDVRRTFLTAVPACRAVLAAQDG